MIQRVIARHRLTDDRSRRDDLRHWAQVPAVERVATVDRLRGEFYGRATRLQRVARIVKLQRS